MTKEQCASLKNLYLRTDLGVLDCLGEVLGVGSYDDVALHSIEVELPAGKCCVLGVDALIQAKEAMGRDHDKMTVKQLKAIKKLDAS